MGVVAGSNVTKLNPVGKEITQITNLEEKLSSRTSSSSSCSFKSIGPADKKSEAQIVDPFFISCTTFNILAPIYKRIDQQNPGLRESDFRAFWLTRNQMILDWLIYESSSIICLQEFWVGNEELVQMYLNKLNRAGYISFKLARTNNRGDGLLTAVHKDYFRVLNTRDLLFNDFGDRVAQLLHVQLQVRIDSKSPTQTENVEQEQELLIVNTHLLFPHNSSLSIVRLHQVYKILQYLESYQIENQLKPIPIILCGDWNGSKRGHVYKFLRSQGFVSSYDTAHRYTDNEADAHKWVSHRNHRGNICGVDFIWLCNPNMPRKPLKTSWAEAVFGIMKNHLRKASMSENDAFAFMKDDASSNFITFRAFCEALHHVKLTGLPNRLSFQDMNDLWEQADLDGNGVVDFDEFKSIWNQTSLEQTRVGGGNIGTRMDESKDGNKEEEVLVGLQVNNAFLFPREVERGMWPENYSLSDHARLTALFSPVTLRK